MRDSKFAFPFLPILQNLCRFGVLASLALHVCDKIIFDSELLRCWKVDRISQLPDHVIDNILIRLPTKDAARMGLLSSRWKQIWHNISHLSFDHYICPTLKKCFPRFSVATIYNILLLHKGPIALIKITTDSASFFEIDHVFRCLSTKRVQDLDIFILSEDYILPLDFYSFIHLRCLKLMGCVLNPPCNFGGFGKLLRLRLCSVQLGSSLLENFINKCPLLEELDMACIFFKEFSIININAQNLKRFYFEGDGSESCFCFMSAPLLKDLAYYDYIFSGNVKRYSEFYGFKKSHLDEFCNALPTLELLSVDSSFLQTLEVGIFSKSPRRTKSLHQLKYLRLFDIHFWHADDVTSVLGLIRSSPNLEGLAIWGPLNRSSNKIDKPFISLVLDCCNFSFEKLQEVSIFIEGDLDTELDFIKFLLSKTPQLKKMIIHPSESKISEKQLDMLKTVSQFERASTAAEIIFEKLD